MERPLLNAAAAMHYTSAKEQIEAEQAGVLAPGYIVPLGVDIEDFCAAKQLARGSSQILFLGRLTKKKRVDIAIRAFALVHRDMPDARLVIAGDDDDGLRRGLEQLCADLLIDGAVRFAGRVDGQAKMDLLGTSAVFVLPSEDENFGIAVVEAMASGMPVVISPDVALHHEIAAADAGIVVQRDPPDVARAMMDYLRSPQKRAIAGHNAVQLVERRFTWDACAKGLEAMYEDMISKRAVDHRIQSASDVPPPR